MRGELRLPVACLALAAAAVGGVALFSAQLARTVNEIADGALGADLVVHAPAPLPSSLPALAGRLGLRASRVIEFPTAVVAGERMQLATVRAVSAPYPLRGAVRLRGRAGGPAHTATGIPPRGTVWAGPGLLAALGLRVGESLSLGTSRLRVGAIVVRAPGTEMDFARIAPLVLMNRADLAATGLAGPQSRVAYELLLAGAPGALAAYRVRARPLLPAQAQLRDVADVTPSLRAPLSATADFLRLAVLATLLIAAAALIQAARHYTATQTRTAAVLKVLGASRARVRGLYALELAWMVTAAGGIGTLVAWLLARLLAFAAAHWFGLAPAPAPLAVLLAAPAAAAMLGAGFWLAPVLAPAAAPAAAALRGAAAPRRWSALGVVSAVAATAGLLFWQGAGSMALTLWALAAAGILVLALALPGLALLRTLGMPPAAIRPAWRYGMAALARRRMQSVAELVAFGLALAVILLLTGVRHDLVSSWHASIPPDAPDHFVVNIQPGQRAAVQRFLDAHVAGRARLYPMARARLTAIDGIPVAQWRQRLTGERAGELLLREQTLSTRAEPGPGNRVTAGHWWRADDRGRLLVSVEAGWARELHVGLGDRLRFALADRTLVLTVASLRKVDWQSFRPNFFLVTPPGTLDGYPQTWITAVHTGGDERVALELLHRFPDLTVVDVGAIIEAVTGLLRRATTALAAVFVLAVLAAVLVLLAALQAGRAQRARELALLRVLGARRRQLAIALAAEFAFLGAVAGTAAGTVAAAAGFVLARRVFDLSAPFDGWLLLAGALGGVLVVGGAGLAATLRLARLPPLAALRARA